MTLYNMGVFNPQMADQALPLLESMDFNQKFEVQQRVQQNATLFNENQQLKEQLIQLAQIIDQHEGTTMAQDLAMSFGMQEGQPMPQGGGEVDLTGEQYEHPYNAQAREQAQASTEVRQ